MNDFIFGFFYPFKSIKLFFKYPKLIGYSIVPIVINLIIYGAIFFYTYRWIEGKSEDAVSNNVSSQILFEIIQYFLKVFYFILVLVVCYFLFVIFGGIVSAPFNEKISKYIEEKIFIIKADTALPFFKDAAASVVAELKKLLFYFSVMIPLLLMEFIPMIGGVITLVIGTGFSFFYNALDYLDYPLTRRMTGFREKLKIVNSKKSLSYGFGAMAFILTFIPVINVFMKPILVAAGTSLFYEKKYSDFKP
ncbi:MAG TPA: EI24 domain-containing protein [Ignavibacteria bacterium]|nr:EI24 domain-containing protein [Ignavibacteria bacterium]